MRVIKKADRIKMPWKNGGGTSFEIDRFPQGAEVYHWRLSQAVITDDGPFSPYPRCDRLLVVWEGAGFHLNEKVLRQFEPYRFKGDDPVRCSLLRGPVTDIGLIFDRAKVDAKMQMVTGKIALPPGVHYIIAHSDWIYARKTLDAGDTVKVEITAASPKALTVVDVPSQTLLVSIGAR